MNLTGDQKDARMLVEAEATCMTLSKTIRSDPSGMDNNNSLIKVTLERARIVRAQGRLDKARQLCEEANSQRLVRTHFSR